ncbi:hypothetical protein AAHA92_16098 [Salvia divinorum]|uniref:J domain-containing protein n=1 Tax=Salvia divinorum TaxID=28513 RepID=A0ABD1GUF8_SALDI
MLVIAISVDRLSGEDVTPADVTSWLVIVSDDIGYDTRFIDWRLKLWPSALWYLAVAVKSVSRPQGSSLWNLETILFSMDCNKDEAIRAKEIAEKKMQSNDFEGARKIALKGKNLDPELENVTQILSICDVHCSAEKRIVGSEKDWYEVLQVEKTADEATIKKQYRRLALMLHPDKNRFPGAEGAFKLICEANALLSDPAKKSAYDKKINAWSRSTTIPPKHQTNRSSQFNSQYGVQNKNMSNGFSSLNQHHNTHSTDFWTQCPFCKVNYKHARKLVNTCLLCRKCSKSYVAYEMPAPYVSSDKLGNQGSQQFPSKPDVDQAAVKASSMPQSGSQGAAENLRTNTGPVRKESKNAKTDSAQAQSARKSSRSRQDVSYMEADEDNHSRPLKRPQTSTVTDANEHKDAAARGDSKHFNQNSFPTVPESSKFENKETGAAHSKESLKNNNEGFNKKAESRGVTGVRSTVPADPVENESSDLDLSSSNDPDTQCLECPDPEFSDFEKMRDENQFRVNQFWACYDTLDSMPRFYAKVRKVCSSPFELHITWLEAVPIHNSCKRWVETELPVGCGSFKTGKPDKISGCLSLSHQVHCEKGKKRGSFFLYPRKGEVWALLRDWDISWGSDPENHEEFRYEIVEVLSDFAEGVGIKVVHLDKVNGFVSLFRRREQNVTNSFLIAPKELYKFSHFVPSFKMTGMEREGVPIGSFELDPASLPLNPDDLYFPGKAKVECRDKDPSAGSSLPKCAEENGKSSKSGRFCSPRKTVDLKETTGEKPRRSPRGGNVMKQSMN